jgi:hypothetical protein
MLRPQGEPLRDRRDFTHHPEAVAVRYTGANLRFFPTPPVSLFLMRPKLFSMVRHA